MVNQKNIEIIIITATIVSLIILEIKYVDKFSNSIYISNLLLTFCLAAVVTTSIYNNNRAKKETEKNETLLEFITKYEKIIDEGRINKHEMLNNLLILKGYQNKNTKRYNEILNGFIDIYSKGSISIRNLHKLPNGLKGLIYYKIKESDFSNVKISVNISNNTSISLNKISAKDYVRLCKIVGIVLDNALEGAIESVEKSVLIESYTIENKLVINIINSCKGKIDLNKISKLNYSSKGKERGIGLYLANKLMDEINIISLKQTLEKKLFITSITVLQ